MDCTNITKSNKAHNSDQNTQLIYKELEWNTYKMIKKN